MVPLPRCRRPARRRSRSAQRKNNQPNAERQARYGKIDYCPKKTVAQLENASKFVDDSPPYHSPWPRSTAPSQPGSASDPPPADVNGVINCVPPSVETRHCRVSLFALDLG
ncbi:MAG TPA: hypothetical protein VJN64_00290 [Terriglobales bacterium]|nr:hypothetical protein [Terriglobales bacterium]